MLFSFMHYILKYKSITLIFISLSKIWRKLHSKHHRLPSLRLSLQERYNRIQYLSLLSQEVPLNLSVFLHRLNTIMQSLTGLHAFHL